jgi:hypothetical protein
MVELEKVTWPKPNAAFIYGTFDEFSAKHPWVGHENIRPKAIARELFEQGQTFNEFIKEYGLQRSEGVLLRYLPTRTRLPQTVPESYRDEALTSAPASGGPSARPISLLDEWER